MSENPPNPPVPPVPPGQPGPRSSDAFGRLLRSVSGRDWLAAVLAAVGGWVAAYVVAAISLLLTVAVLAAGGSGSGSVGSGSTGTGTDLGAGSTPDVQSLLSGVSVLLGTPAQLVALADLGRLHLSGSIGFLGSGSGALAVVPAVVLAAQVVLAVVLTRRIRTRGLGRAAILLTAVLSGLVTTVLTNAAAGILAIRFPAVSGAVIDPVHAVGLGSILGAFVIGALAAVLARPSALLGRNVFAGRVLGTVRVAASQLTVLVVLVTVVVIVVALVAQPSWGAALPVLVGNVAVGLTALGFLGGVGLSGFGSAGSTASVFGGAGGWTWLVVLLVVVTSVVAGLALAVRRNDRFRTTLDWVVTPVVWFALGLLLFVLGTGLVSYQATGISAVSGTGSIGIAPWTPLVFALWGGAIEAVARYLAPVLLPASAVAWCCGPRASSERTRAPRPHRPSRQRLRRSRRPTRRSRRPTRRSRRRRPRATRQQQRGRRRPASATPVSRNSPSSAVALPHPLRCRRAPRRSWCARSSPVAPWSSSSSRVPSPPACSGPTCGVRRRP
ncbi:hypothetical protein [Curtobacterium sp. 24E2]|nr:hypothetical protein JN350_14730 [Curtobacterium sp. 24E2]